jgi:hypothetical protein
MLSLLGPVTIAVSCTARCPCTVLPGDDTLSVATTIRKARDEAHAVFAGQVVHLDTLELDSAYLGGSRRPIVQPRVLRYHLDSVRTWKGPDPDVLEILVYNAQTDCGRTLEVGTRYLVFAYRARPGRDARRRVEIDACSLVLPTARAGREMDVLGPARSRRRGGARLRSA